jgi:glyoxylase-like metal-dependent hydrolase (beta-lactamase superfamily II)
LRAFTFDGPAVWGFPASHDVLGDGSIVAVPLPGHTPGSAGYVVSSGDGARWLFVGDAVWAREGIERPAAKGVFARALSWRRRVAAATIGRLTRRAATSGAPDREPR